MNTYYIAYFAGNDDTTELLAASPQFDTYNEANGLYQSIMAAWAENRPHSSEPPGCQSIALKIITIPPAQGIDYGTGSQRRRFGGMRVPRGAYQFRG